VPAPAVRFDGFYGYDELTELLHAWAGERPELVRVESIGKSWEGRDIWLATATNTATGPDLEKPAFLLEANIHSVEWMGCTAALCLLERLLDGYGSDDRVTYALDTRAFYVVPRLNPDGAERALKEGRFIRSSVRPYPRDEVQDGLRYGDVDGDGRALEMRVRDPNGPWKAHPEEPRLLVRREPDEREGEFYRLFPEGSIENWDGVTVKVAPALEGLDLNRQFPVEWSPEAEQKGAGPYPASEPEIRAYLQAVVDRPNVCCMFAYHTWSGVHLRPYAGYADEHFPTDDLRAYEVLGEKATELTGYPTMSVFHGFRYDPKKVRKGGGHDWFYDHLGVYSWTTEFWSPPRQAGLDVAAPVEWIRDHPPEDDLKVLRWADEEFGRRGYVDWYPFEHPQLGAVELGGWDLLRFWFNTPVERLEQEVRPHAELALFHALVTPLLEVRSLEAERVGETTSVVRLVLENSGWLPTNVSKKALEREAVRPIEVELDLPEGARLLAGEVRTELGQLEGRHLKRTTTWWGNDESTLDRTKAEWVVEAPAGARLGVVARHQRAGTVRRELEL
jgi:murein tripeptide amidase MpaA